MADGSAITTSPTGKKSAIKDPNATLDFSFDWSDWLSEIGDAISTHEFIIVDPPGATTPLNKVSSLQSNGIVTAFVSGGTLGKRHALICRITSTNAPPRIDDRTLYIVIKDR